MFKYLLLINILFIITENLTELSGLFSNLMLFRKLLIFLFKKSSTSYCLGRFSCMKHKILLKTL